MTKNRTLEGLSRTGKVNTEVGSGGTVKEDVLIWQDFIAGPKPVKTKKDRKQPAALFRTSREHLARPRPAQVELLTRLTFDPTLIPSGKALSICNSTKSAGLSTSMASFSKSKRYVKHQSFDSRVLA